MIKLRRNTLRYILCGVVFCTLTITFLNRNALRKVHKRTEELEHVQRPTYMRHYNDFNEHKRGNKVASALRAKIRVLCWIMTCPDYLELKARHVKATWGKRCNKLIFVSDDRNDTFPVLSVNTTHGREHLTAKTMRAFDYIYKHHYHDADWFLKADDDTYVIMENLRYLLSAHAPTEPVYFGHPLMVLVTQGFPSGGGGYVLSKAALQRFGTRERSLCKSDGGVGEDVEIGFCMEKLHVVLGDSNDKLGRSRFHCLPPEIHLHQTGYPYWYYGMHNTTMKNDISDYPISFHYVSPQQMYDLEYYVYHLSVYGIDNSQQNLNIVDNSQQNMNIVDISQQKLQIPHVVTSQKPTHLAGLTKPRTKYIKTSDRQEQNTTRYVYS